MSLEKLFITEDQSVLSAMKRIDVTARQILLVVENGRLKGIITDGDIRRHMLHGGTLEEKISNVANYHPHFIYEKDKVHSHELMKKWSILSLPVVNEELEIQSVVFLNDDEIGRNHTVEAPVVIMAGGLGTRLYPYTKILPKPLIPIGEMPITEHIINQFLKYNCNEFHLIVNHKKNMIKAYFNDVEKDYGLEFYEEDKPLGTGGGLSLLKGKIKDTFFLTNCDVLIRANYKEIFDFHKKNENMITVVAAFKHMIIPYGVINMDYKGNVGSMTEKPEYSFLTNTGFYVVEPEVIEQIGDDIAIGFPDIIEQLRIKGEKIGVFPVSEKSWLDMGQLEELEVMRKELGV